MVLWLLILLAGSALADEPPVYESFETPYGDVLAWGSASQAYIWVDGGYSFFGSGDDAFGYREISLGGKWKFLPWASLNLQGEYRDAGESDDLGVRFTQGFIDAAYYVGERTVVGTNLGRIEVPWAFYNRTRDRVDTRPSIVLPQSIYLESLGLRNFLLTGDGGMIYGEHGLTDNSQIRYRVSGSIPSFVDGDAPLYSGWAEYGWGGVFRFRFSTFVVEQDESEIDYPVLSAQYVWKRWTLTSEYGRLTFNSPGGSLTSNGVYGQVEYGVTPDFTLFGRYDYLHFDIDTPVPISFPDDLLHAQSFVTGFGWDLSRYFRLNAEWHFVNGKAFLNSAENPGLVDGPDDYNILMLMGTFRF